MLRRDNMALRPESDFPLGFMLRKDRFGSQDPRRGQPEMPACGLCVGLPGRIRFQRIELCRDERSNRRGRGLSINGDKITWVKEAVGWREHESIDIERLTEVADRMPVDLIGGWEIAWFLAKQNGGQECKAEP